MRRGEDRNQTEKEHFQKEGNSSIFPARHKNRRKVPVRLREEVQKRSWERFNRCKVHSKIKTESSKVRVTKKGSAI